MSIHFLYKGFDDEEKGMLYTWFMAMHTRIDIILCHKPEEELKDVARRIKFELTELEKLANYYDTESELYKLNQQASDHPVTVSKELYHMINSALQYRSSTLGCFNVSVQSLNFHSDTWRNIKLLPDFTSIYFQEPGIRIDLSGFLKGYALDKIKGILAENEITDALISLGNSSVLALGKHPHGEGWKVGFNHLLAATERKEVLLRNECLTTSGNDTLERKHIISPVTGKPVEGIKHVAVVTTGGAEGEVLSTALFVATPEQRNKILESFEVKSIYTT